MEEMTNRQMAAAFKKIGFKKSEFEVTRIGNSYTYKDSGALFTFPKAHKEKFQISAPGYDGWSCIILSQAKWDDYQENPYIDWHWDKKKPFSERVTPMEALLCIARGFAKQYDEND